MRGRGAGRQEKGGLWEQSIVDRALGDARRHLSTMGRSLDELESLRQVMLLVFAGLIVVGAAVLAVLSGPSEEAGAAKAGTERPALEADQLSDSDEDEDVDKGASGD